MGLVDYHSYYLWPSIFTIMDTDLLYWWRPIMTRHDSIIIICQKQLLEVPPGTMIVQGFHVGWTWLLHLYSAVPVALTGYHGGRKCTAPELLRLVLAKSLKPGWHTTASRIIGTSHPVFGANSGFPQRRPKTLANLLPLCRKNALRCIDSVYPKLIYCFCMLCWLNTQVSAT